MSKLETILDDSAAAIYCAGQDWSKSNPTTYIVDREVASAKQQIKDLMLELINRTSVSYLGNPDMIETEKLRQKVNEL